MKMPTIVGIFIFISKENFMLSWVEHEEGFIISGPELLTIHILKLEKYIQIPDDLAKIMLWNDMAESVDPEFELSLHCLPWHV